MALFQIDFFSESLARAVEVSFILPNDQSANMTKENPHYQRNVKTLYLFHGYSANNKDWLTGSRIQEFASKYNLAVVMPAAENSFYLNGKGTGKAYGTYVGEELVSYMQKTFHLSAKKEDNFLCGLSMGGFGSIHTALMYPDTFSKSAALSSALIVNSIKNMEPGTGNPIADYDYYYGVFGDLTKLDESENNPEYLIRRLKSAGKKIPDLYMACGTEDFLIEENREFHRFLMEQEIQVMYTESPGVHDWNFWNEYLEPSIKWMLS